MPHGGGHGGGGHGGGGHGGGGHGGGGHGSSISTSDGDGSSSGNGTACCLVLGIVLTLLIVPVTVSYKKNCSSSSLVLSPGDTRIVSRSSTLCQTLGATLSGVISDSSLTAMTAINSFVSNSSYTSSMHFLSNTPALSVNNSFVISSSPMPVAVLAGDYTYWSFHLYPGSKYSLTACLSSGYSVTYYVIKGTSNYNSWVKTPSIQSAYGNFVLYVVNPCKVAGYNMTASLNFTSEDEYYFIFYNDDDYVHADAKLQFKFSFYRTEYSPQSGGIISNCTTTSLSSCSLDIPYNSDYIILLVTSPPADGDWGANLYVTSSCVARAWVFAVIEVGMFAFVVISAITCAAAYCACALGICESHKGKQTRVASNHTTVQLTSVVATQVPISGVLTAPPLSIGLYDAPPTCVFTTPPPPPPIGFKDAPVTGVLTAPPPPDYAYGVLAPPAPDENAPPPYEDEPPQLAPCFQSTDI